MGWNPAWGEVTPVYPTVMGYLAVLRGCLEVEILKTNSCTSLYGRLTNGTLLYLIFTMSPLSIIGYWTVNKSIITTFCLVKPINLLTETDFSETLKCGWLFVQFVELLQVLAGLLM